MARTGPRRSRGGSFAVAGALLLAGAMFATSADTAAGTDLRDDERDLRALVTREDGQLRAEQARVARLDAQVGTLTGARGGAQADVLTRRADDLAVAAGLVPVEGPGLVVTLADAPTGRSVPPGYVVDDLVVHQQDVQAVVNALWAGGAEAMGLMDQRVVSTSAVRCVGSTLELQGRYYPPPYVIRAVGDPGRLEAALASSAQVSAYRRYVDLVGLGWSVESEQTVRLPGFSGSLDLTSARVLPRWHDDP